MADFKLIVLGCSGGPDESDVSGYLLGYHNEFVGLDAGSLLHGLKIALGKHSLEGIDLTDPFLSPLGVMFQKRIKGYLLSHPHLDHIAGLVINSQSDLSKTIYGSAYTIDILRDHVFNGKVWINFANEGEGALSLYKYRRLEFGKRAEISDTKMTVTAFPLVHGTSFDSTAFLVEKGGEAVLYFGDTKSDKETKSNEIKNIWKAISPFVTSGKLKAILIESSYEAHEKGAGKRFHLKTDDLKEELTDLQKIAGASLKGLKVVVTHRKEDFSKNTYLPEKIQEELEENNSLGIHYIFPHQGELISL